MAIAASVIASRVRTLIQDAGGTRWPDAELLGWINDGQREIALHKPEAAATTAAKLLTAGKTKQSLTAMDTAAFQFMDILRNAGATGSDASFSGNDGRAIRAISREVLDAQTPTWHSDTNVDGYIKHFVFDPRDPLTFFVYPKAPATAWYVELVYAKTPAPLVLLSGAVTFTDSGDTVGLTAHGLTNGTPVLFTSITTTTGVSVDTVYYVVNAAANTFQVSTTAGGAAAALTTNGTGVVSTALGIPDIYANILTDYVVFRAYMKDVEYAGNNGLAQQYYDRFAAAIGIKQAGEILRLPGPPSKAEGNPNVA